MIFYLKNIFFLTIILLALSGLSVVNAQENVQNDIRSDIQNNVMDMPSIVTNAGQDSIITTSTYPTMNLTQDKSEMVHLKQNAASVVIGNPNHISVMLDTPNTLVVVPRLAGASHFSVIGEDGSVIMERHVIVGAPKEQYVRIRRSCNANSRDCQPTSTYYCPDMCHEVQENTQRQR